VNKLLMSTGDEFGECWKQSLAQGQIPYVTATQAPPKPTSTTPLVHRNYCNNFTTTNIVISISITLHYITKLFIVA